MHAELKTPLSEALAEAMETFSRSAHDLDARRYELCAMWSYVITSAPDELVVTAAKQVATSFHPKAELSIPPILHHEVETLALGLISEENYKSYEVWILECLRQREECIRANISPAE